MAYMNANDAINAKLAEVFVTIGNRRYSLMCAKNFNATTNIKTKEVSILGRTVSAFKPVGMTIKFSMTVYKVSEIFDAIIEEYKDTGLLPTFDIQVTNEDKASKSGRETTLYTDCMVDGDVLISMLDCEGGFIEQSISGYAQDFTKAEKFTTPSYM